MQSIPKKQKKIKKKTREEIEERQEHVNFRDLR